jgi:hypothetical protein
MATEPPTRAALLFTESTPTRVARIRVVINDLINLILGLELATRTPMPALPTSLATLPVSTHQLLRLRARLRAPLRPGFRRIHRRWLRARARVLASLLLKPLQPIIVLLKPAREIENELHTRLTP